MHEWVYMYDTDYYQEYNTQTLVTCYQIAGSWPKLQPIPGPQYTETNTISKIQALNLVSLATTTICGTWLANYALRHVARG